MNRLLTILLLAAGTAYGQIDNPPTTFPLPATFSTNVTVSGTATFATNVSVAGILSVGSLNTATPATWALDSADVASGGFSEFRLTLPDNANVIRITSSTPINRIGNGRLGAFYYLINATTNALVINSGNGITIQGGSASLTLGANQAATLVATGATNASVAARGDLNDVTLGGTANTAPSQTASSGASLMTRDLVDARSLNAAINTMPNLRYTGITAAGGTVLDSAWNSGVYTASATTNAIGFGRLQIPHDSMQFGSDLTPFKFWVFTRVILYTATNASNSVTFGISGTTNSTEFPVQSATSTNPAYVSFGTNQPNDNRYAVQLRRSGSDLQARFIAMRPSSPSGVYFETVWTNILSGFGGDADLVTRPVIIALNRNGTNVAAYYGITDSDNPYEDFNSLTLLGSHTLSTAKAADFGIAFRAVSISGDSVRVEFLNTSAVLTP